MMMLIAIGVLIMFIRHFSSVMSTASNNLMIHDVVAITIMVNKL